MGTHRRWTEGPGWGESNVHVHLAGAPGVRQGGLEGSDSDGKEVRQSGGSCRDSLNGACLSSLGTSLLSHGDIGGGRVRS